MLLPRRFSSPASDLSPLAGDGGASVLAAELRAATALGLMAWHDQPRLPAVDLATALSGGLTQVPLCVTVPAEMVMDDGAGCVADALALLRLQARLTGSRPPVVMMPVEHPEALTISGEVAATEASRVASVFGQRHLQRLLDSIIDACDRDTSDGFDPEKCAPLGQAVAQARATGVPEASIRAALALAAEGAEFFPLVQPAATEELSGVMPVVLSVPDALIEAALTRHGFSQGDFRHADAADMLDTLATQIWLSGQPHLQFRDRLTAIPAPQESALRASLRVWPFVATDGFDAARFVDAVRLVALHAADRGAGAVVLALTDMAPAVMAAGLAYDSAAGRAFVAAVCALATATLASTAADVAATTGRPANGGGRDGFCLQLKAMRDRLGGAAFGTDMSMVSAVDATQLLPSLRQTVTAALDDAVAAVRQHGMAVWPLSRIDSEIMIVDALAAGLMPLAQLVAVDEDADVPAQLSPPVRAGLTALGYAAEQIDAIDTYVTGHGTLQGAPAINADSLGRAGLDATAIARVEKALASGARTLAHAINVWTLGRGYCQEVLGLPEDTDDILMALGFDADAIAVATAYACGAGTLAGAPHLSVAHQAVFATHADVTAASLLAMQAAAETGLTDGVWQVLPLPPETSVQTLRQLILSGWERGVANLAFYRHGSGLDAAVAPVVQRQSEDQAVENKDQKLIFSS